MDPYRTSAINWQVYDKQTLGRNRSRNVKVSLEGTVGFDNQVVRMVGHFELRSPNARILTV